MKAWMGAATTLGWVIMSVSVWAGANKQSDTYAYTSAGADKIGLGVDVAVGLASGKVLSDGGQSVVSYLTRSETEKLEMLTKDLQWAVRTGPEKFNQTMSHVIKDDYNAFVEKTREQIARSEAHLTRLKSVKIESRFLKSPVRWVSLGALGFAVIDAGGRLYRWMLEDDAFHPISERSLEALLRSGQDLERVRISGVEKARDINRVLYRERVKIEEDLLRKKAELKQYLRNQRDATSSEKQHGLESVAGSEAVSTSTDSD
jgi:hypothetical protein